MLSVEQITSFQTQGFLKVESKVAKEQLAIVQKAAKQLVEHPQQPIEYEADLGYPGAPNSLVDRGGQTIRRFLQLYQRDKVFHDWLNDDIKTDLRSLLGPKVWLCLAHHNCLMTKHPEFSSDSCWHKDIRYWSFSRRDLVTTWLALGEERVDNGCLQVIPGSHQAHYEAERFDEARFLREDHPDNQELFKQAVPVELAPGDVLYFHCRLVHAATRNFTDESKLAVVYTFRGEGDEPLPGTRSEQGGEVALP